MTRSGPGRSTRRAAGLLGAALSTAVARGQTALLLYAGTTLLVGALYLLFWQTPVQKAIEALPGLLPQIAESLPGPPVLPLVLPPVLVPAPVAEPGFPAALPAFAPPVSQNRGGLVAIPRAAPPPPPTASTNVLPVPGPAEVRLEQVAEPPPAGETGALIVAPLPAQAPALASPAVAPTVREAAPADGGQPRQSTAAISIPTVTLAQRHILTSPAKTKAAEKARLHEKAEAAASAEAAKKAAEAERKAAAKAEEQAAEAEKHTAEEARQAAEAQKQAAEAEKEVADAQKRAAEQEQKAAEDQRKAAEEAAKAAGRRVIAPSIVVRAAAGVPPHGDEQPHGASPAAAGGADSNQSNGDQHKDGNHKDDDPAKPNPKQAEDHERGDGAPSNAVTAAPAAPGPPKPAKPETPAERPHWTGATNAASQPSSAPDTKPANPAKPAGPAADGGPKQGAKDESHEKAAATGSARQGGASPTPETPKDKVVSNDKVEPKDNDAAKETARAGGSQGEHAEPAKANKSEPKPAEAGPRDNKH